jgi:hypothetical protein
MFFPMSCTSPFTVARTMVPAWSSSASANCFARRASAASSGASPAASRASASRVASARASAFSSSMKGMSQATARFMTRALFTTWGRNIFPAPKRSPTTFIPSMRGPSMTSMARSAPFRASSVSSSTNSVIPCTRACSSRFATGQLRHARSTFGPVSPEASAPMRSAIPVRRSVASGRRFRSTSSTASSSSPGMSS